MARARGGRAVRARRKRRCLNGKRLRELQPVPSLLFDRKVIDAFAFVSTSLCWPAFACPALPPSCNNLPTPQPWRQLLPTR